MSKSSAKPFLKLSINNNYIQQKGGTPGYKQVFQYVQKIIPGWT
jgi:hypothetical protein